jgi:hypothetical protein
MKLLSKTGNILPGCFHSRRISASLYITPRRVLPQMKYGIGEDFHNKRGRSNDYISAAPL